MSVQARSLGLAISTSVTRQAALCSSKERCVMNVMKRRLLLQVMLVLIVICTGWFVGQQQLKAVVTPFEV